MAGVFVQHVSPRWAALIVSDAALIPTAVLLGVGASLGLDYSDLLVDRTIVAKALVIVAVCHVSLYYGDLYRFGAFGDPRTLFARLTQSLGAALLVLAAAYVVFPKLIIGNGAALMAVAVVIIAVFGSRLLFDSLSRRVRPRERLLIVGVSPAATQLVNELSARRELGVEVVGFIVPDDGPQPEYSVTGANVLGGFDAIPGIVAARQIDRVVVSLADARNRLPMNQLLTMKLHNGITFDHLASVYEEYTGKVAVEYLRPSWIVFSRGFRRSRQTETLKRAFDVTFSAVALICAVPLLLVAAMAVRLTSRGPALYRQERIGYMGRHFTMYKLRSMYEGAEAQTGPVWARPGDARVTRIGRFLRRSRLDELPQLWNVLRGDMSLVGPRPERPVFVLDLTLQLPFYEMRHAVRPGLTGWAQVHYGYGATVDAAVEKLQYDLFYIKNLSLMLDLLTLIKTVRTVVSLKGDVADDRDDAVAVDAGAGERVHRSSQAALSRNLASRGFLR